MRSLSNEIKFILTQNSLNNLEHFGRSAQEVLEDIVCHTLDEKGLESNVKHVMSFINNEIFDICFKFIKSGVISEKILAAIIMTNLLSIDNIEILDLIIEKCSSDFFPSVYGALESLYEICLVQNNGKTINCTEDQFYELTFQLIWAIANYIADDVARIHSLGMTRIIQIVDIINSMCKNQEFAESCLIF